MQTSSKAELREQLRAQAPDLAAFVDDLRAMVGPVKITYLKIGEFEVGTPMDSENCVPLSDTTPVKQLMDKWYADTDELLASMKRSSGKKRGRK